MKGAGGVGGWGGGLQKDSEVTAVSALLFGKGRG